MSFLTDAEIVSLRVDRVILHLVDKQQEFKSEPEIDVQQEALFRTRIIDQAASAVHSFTEHSNVLPLLHRMATGELEFEVGGQELARLQAGHLIVRTDANTTRQWAKIWLKATWVKAASRSRTRPGHDPRAQRRCPVSG